MSENVNEMREAGARLTASLDEFDRIATMLGRDRYDDVIYGLNDHAIRRSDIRTILAALAPVQPDPLRAGVEALASRHEAALRDDAPDLDNDTVDRIDGLLTSLRALLAETGGE